ncbi:unnamed protein product [Protopolystoma xenopodis]|uniref:Uncharacterized protein n=1 Tax=Protopolystoma xenopodis TaxID=117903 RepID=A0A448WTP1_9PLAT|nr:unnamed protein product [Protopolystoma xenopodis]
MGTFVAAEFTGLQSPMVCSLEAAESAIPEETNIRAQRQALTRHCPKSDQGAVADGGRHASEQDSLSLSYGRNLVASIARIIDGATESEFEIYLEKEFFRAFRGCKRTEVRILQTSTILRCLHG